MRKFRPFNLWPANGRVVPSMRLVGLVPVSTLDEDSMSVEMVGPAREDYRWFRLCSDTMQKIKYCSLEEYEWYNDGNKS